MNFGPNFNNRQLFTRESKSTTRSININQFNERTGARTVDDVMMSRLRLKDQLNPNIYGPEQMRKLNNKKNNEQPVVNNNQNPSRAERQFNHIEAMRSIRRGN